MRHRRMSVLTRVARRPLAAGVCVMCLTPSQRAGAPFMNKSIRKGGRAQCAVTSGWHVALQGTWSKAGTTWATSAQAASAEPGDRPSTTVRYLRACRPSATRALDEGRLEREVGTPEPHGALRAGRLVDRAGFGGCWQRKQSGLVWPARSDLFGRYRRRRLLTSGSSGDPARTSSACGRRVEGACCAARVHAYRDAHGLQSARNSMPAIVHQALRASPATPACACDLRATSM